MNKILTLFLLTLLGSANGQSILTMRQVYDFNVGDEFDYEDVRSIWYPKDTLGNRNTILARKYSKNLDTITYKIKVDSYKLSNKNSKRTFTLSSIVIDTSYTDLDSIISNRFRQKAIESQMLYLKDTFCFLSDLGVNGFKYRLYNDLVGFSGIIGEGIGLVYQAPMGIGCIADFSWIKLLYYKKGNLEFGTKDKNYNIVIDTSFLSEDVSFYPNPVISKIHFSKPLLSNYTISIIDCAGRTLLKRSDFDFEYEMDISSIAKGLYFLKLETTQQTIIKKFIKG